MKKAIATGCLVLTAITFPALAYAQGFQIRKISDKIAIATAEDGGESQWVIQSAKGLVVIDSFWSEITAKKFKKEIASAFNRDDFAYALNLVDRLDMFGGNAAYKGAKIIGHDSFLGKYKGKEKEVEAEIKQLIEMWRWKAEVSRKRRETQEKGSEKAIAEKRWMKTCTQRAEELENGFSLLLPELFYNDRMTLDLGDITLKLIWFGKAGNHDGMTVVVIPEEKLAIIPGFILHPQHLAPYPFSGYAKLDVPRWISVLAEVLEGDHAVDRVICGMTDIWSRERAQTHLEYIRRLWDSVKTAEADGKDLGEVEDQLSFDREFAWVKKMVVYQEHGDQWLRPQHQAHIRVFFLQHKNLASEIINTTGMDALRVSLAEIRRLRDQGSDLYFDEASFNGIGYSLMNSGRFLEALDVFQLNVELFPGSANAFDSLGEAYMKTGNRSLAIEKYRKSLELNPQNDNAKKMLEQLQEKQ
jgi:tetratricopeptide (TPR) repeat protein